MITNSWARSLRLKAFKIITHGKKKQPFPWRLFWAELIGTTCCCYGFVTGYSDVRVRQSDTSFSGETSAG
jgi:hypothetical protein